MEPLRADSDISRCNAAAGAATAVAPETIEVLTRAIQLWEETEHRFDPTVLRSLVARGYDETFSRIRERPADFGCCRVLARPPGRPAMELVVPCDAPSVAPAPGCAGVMLDPAGRTVTLPEGLGLDIGGIGKGYAADIVARGIVERGAGGACVSVGGDVRCIGVAPGPDGWEIPVEDPFDAERVLFTHRVEDGAIVTTTKLFRRWRHGGRWQHHLIDPASGAPVEGSLAAVVVEDSEAWRAEGWAKAAFVGGPQVGLELLEQAGLRGWLIDDDGRLVASTAAHEIEEQVA